jgi:hypothetical protein
MSGRRGRERRRPDSRRNWGERVPRRFASRSGEDRRVSGLADRRREIQADLAALHRRRSDLCTSTCIHAQDEPWQERQQRLVAELAPQQEVADVEGWEADEFSRGLGEIDGSGS